MLRLPKPISRESQLTRLSGEEAEHVCRQDQIVYGVEADWQLDTFSRHRNRYLSVISPVVKLDPETLLRFIHRQINYFCKDRDFNVSYENVNSRHIFRAYGTCSSGYNTGVHVCDSLLQYLRPSYSETRRVVVLDGSSVHEIEGPIDFVLSFHGTRKAPYIVD